MNNIEILHSMQELFTIVSTGESGVSLRGLSRLSGIPKSNLIRWFEKDLTHKNAPEALKALSSKALYLTHEIKVRGKSIKAVRASIASQVIKYAAFTLQKPEAQAAISEFIDVGLDSYIQGATGFLPEENQASTRDARYEITRLVKDANPWRRLYSKAVCEKVRSWYFPRNFFWKYAYSWMTPQEIAFLEEHNPVIEGIWQRRDRIFQMLSEETRDRLEPEIASLCLLIETSTCKADFETRYDRAKGLDQKELYYV